MTGENLRCGGGPPGRDRKLLPDSRRSVASLAGNGQIGRGSSHDHWLPVRLRELAESDVAPLHGVYGNEEATRHLSFEPRTTDQVEGIIKAAMKAATAEPRTEYALAVAGEDDALGT